MSKSGQKFSKTVWILKDLKKKESWDVIKITSRIDAKPVLFDFGSGNVMVIRYTVETFDGLVNLFVPAVNSFQKKIIVGKFFELGSKRCYNYELPDRKSNDWIIYVNRIKNLTQINLKLGERLDWQAQTKTKNIDFPFDESWLEKSLPIKNNLIDCKAFFENLEDIDTDTLLCLPLKLLRIEEIRKIEIVEPTGSIIKNIEYQALNHKSKVIKLYVPYFLRDVAKIVSEKLSDFNVLINRLKVFYKATKEETYAGFLWDPTLSGFLFQPKLDEHRVMDIKNAEDLFGRVDGHSLIDFIVNDHRKTEEKLLKNRKKGGVPKSSQRLESTLSLPNEEDDFDLKEEWYGFEDD